MSGDRALIESWTSYRRIPAADSEYECSGCRNPIRKGSPIWWEEPHYEYGDCDGYCQRCAAETARGYQGIVAAIESGEINPLNDGEGLS